MRGRVRAHSRAPSSRCVPDAALTSHGSEVAVCLSLAVGKGADGGEDDEGKREQQDLGTEGDVTTHGGGAGPGSGTEHPGRGLVAEPGLCLFVLPRARAPASVSPSFPSYTHPSIHPHTPPSILLPSIQPWSIHPSALAHVPPSVCPSVHLCQNLSMGLSLPPSLPPSQEAVVGSGGSTHRDAGSRLRCLVA